MLLHAQRVLKVFPHAVLVVIQLVWICNSNLRWLVLIELVLNGLSYELLRGNLYLSGGIVFDPWHFHHAALLIDH